ncbi:DUF5110 domain-containing protein, partial [Oenococcus oeni]
PMYPAQNYVGEKKISQLTLDIYPFTGKGESCYEHYQDDGESFDYRSGSYNLYDFILKRSGNLIEINISKTREAYGEKYQSFKFIINGIKPLEFLVDGQTGKIENDDDQFSFTVSNTAKKIDLKF